MPMKPLSPGEAWAGGKRVSSGCTPCSAVFKNILSNKMKQLKNSEKSPNLIYHNTFFLLPAAHESNSMETNLVWWGRGSGEGPLLVHPESGNHFGCRPLVLALLLTAIQKKRISSDFLHKDIFICCNF